MKAERPILFNSEMVRAVLDGAKTQTRRVIKGAALPKLLDEPFDGDDGKTYKWISCPSTHPRWGFGVFGETEEECAKELEKIGCGCPYGDVGDQLWVRETFHNDNRDTERARAEHEDVMSVSPIFYKADTLLSNSNIDPLPKDAGWIWKPSIYMPRWASRIQLEVTGVRVERVQDISEDDAIAEGVINGIDYPYENGELPCPSCNGQGVHGAFGANYGVTEVDCTTCDTYIKRFRILWDSINAKRGYGWDKNPYVWVVEFKMLDANITPHDAKGGER